MNTYRLRVRRIPRLARFSWCVSALSAEHLTTQLPDASVREVSGDDSYYGVVELQLSRDTHEEALNEILLAIQLLGFEAVNASVTEWADRAVEGALLGFAGGGTAGAASGDADVAAVIALAASIVGGLVGSQLKRVEKIYELTPAFPTGWVLTPVPLQEPREP